MNERMVCTPGCDAADAWSIGSVVSKKRPVKEESTRGLAERSASVARKSTTVATGCATQRERASRVVGRQQRAGGGGAARRARHSRQQRLCEGRGTAVSVPDRTVGARGRRCTCAWARRRRTWRLRRRPCSTRRWPWSPGRCAGLSSRPTHVRVQGAKRVRERERERERESIHCTRRALSSEDTRRGHAGGRRTTSLSG
jgi:hypothetical protein